MKKIILTLIAFIALLAACSKIEIKPEPEPEPPVEYPKITINAKKTDLSLFEKVDAFLGLEGEKEELHGIGFGLTGYSILSIGKSQTCFSIPDLHPLC